MAGDVGIVGILFSKLFYAANAAACFHTSALHPAQYS